MEERLKRKYRDPKAAGSYQGPLKLYQSLKRDGEQDVTLKDVKKYLQKEDVYTLNRAVKTKFPRNRVVVAGIDSQIDMDLADLQLLSKDNDGYKYFLLAIDIFSRYVWVRSLKTKMSKEIVKALQSILAEGRKPRSIRTDGGKEFQNGTVKSFLAKQGIRIFQTYNSTQANYAERAIKTIKGKLYRYMIENNTLRYINVLQDITESYNKTVHSSLGVPPNQVTKENENEIRYNQYLLRRKPKNDFQTPHQNMNFKVGDQVRVSYLPEKFDREYSQRFSGEVFIVASRRRRNTIPVYKLTDWYGEPIKGTFYQQQLQKVDINDRDNFKIEKILKRRRRGGRNQVFIKWKYWPKRFNQWINEDDITPL